MSPFTNNKLTVRTNKMALEIGFWSREVGYGLEELDLRIERSMLFDDRFEIVFTDFNESGFPGETFYARTLNTDPAKKITFHRCNRGEMSWLDI